MEDALEGALVEWEYLTLLDGTYVMRGDLYLPDLGNGIERTAVPEVGTCGNPRQDP